MDKQVEKSRTSNNVISQERRLMNEALARSGSCQRRGGDPRLQPAASCSCSI
jgi:hypothetical protein